MVHKLRLSNAFSTIAVIEHKVIAVITSLTPELLKVIAIPTISTKEDLSIAPEPLKNVSHVWKFTFTQNPYRSN